MSTLYLLPTPIGNLEDITLRTLRLLKETEYLACEDTRHTQKLLSYYEISGKKLVSFHSHSGGMKIAKILELLEEGNDIALVSDAGTPGISDPGTALVEAVLRAGWSVVPLPGPTAFVPALVASGLPTMRFEFFGFLPHKKGRQSLLREIAAYAHTAVCYESPHRILKFLREGALLFPDRLLILARELTKVHEDFLRGSALELLEILESYPEKQKGEFVVLIGPPEKGTTRQTKRKKY